MKDTFDWQQAQTFAQIGNWSDLTQHLQHLLLTQPLDQLALADQRQILAWALLALESGDFHTRWEVAKVLPALGDLAIAPLMALLQDEDAELETRWFAARILGKFDTPATIQALIAILQANQDDELNLVTAEALANSGSPAIAALTALLPDDQTRPLAVKALAQIRSPETIDPLLQVLSDSQPGVRAIAVEALGSFADPRIAPALLQALTDPAAIVRQAAITSLGVRSDQLETADFVKHLVERLWDLNLSVCQQAAIALGRCGTDAAVAALLNVLQSPHTPPPLQLEAVRALGWAGTGTALEALHQTLLHLETSPPYTVYQEIITVLGRWTDATQKPDATQILVNALYSQHPAVSQIPIQQAIALGLGHLEQPAALAPLSHLLATDDMGVRLHAIAALKSLAAQNTRQHLERLANQTNLSAAMREGVAIALAEWGRGSRE